MWKWLASIWNDNMSFFQQWLLIYRGIPYAYFLGNLKPRNFLHSCNLSHVKYFWMSENLILPPLLFTKVFLGCKGLQYIHYFFVFWVISNFFNCKKSKFSRPAVGLLAPSQRYSMIKEEEVCRLWPEKKWLLEKVKEDVVVVPKWKLWA